MLCWPDGMFLLFPANLLYLMRIFFKGFGAHTMFLHFLLYFNKFKHIAFSKNHSLSASQQTKIKEMQSTASVWELIKALLDGKYLTRLKGKFRGNFYLSSIVWTELDVHSFSLRSGFNLGISEPDKDAERAIFTYTLKEVKIC